MLSTYHNRVHRTPAWIQTGLALAITTTVGIASAQEPPGAPDLPFARPSTVWLTPNVNDQFSDDPGDPHSGASAAVPAASATLFPANLDDDDPNKTEGIVYDGPSVAAEMPFESGGFEFAQQAPPRGLPFTNTPLGDVQEIRDRLSGLDFPIDDDSPQLSGGVPEGQLRVLITLRPVQGVSSADQSSALSRANEVASALNEADAVVERVYEHVPVITATIDANGLDALLASDAVGAIELDRIEHFPLLASSKPVTGIETVYADGVRADGDHGNDPWEVVVMDTGVRTSHEKFASRVVAEACYTTDASCANGSNVMTGAGASAPCNDFRCDHGTHVAGIAVAGTVNLTEPVGYAPESNLVAIRIANDSSGASTNSYIGGINFTLAREAAGGRVASLNLSYGSSATYLGTCDTLNPALTSAFLALRNAGILPAVAAGNNGSSTRMSSPACISHAFAIGNTTDTDAVSSSSNASTVMEMWAPGTSIRAAGLDSDTDYVTKTGTSMAAPAYAGAAAAFYDCVDSSDFSNGGAPPNSYDDSVANWLRSRGDAVTDTRFGGSVTKPRLNIERAAAQYNLNDTWSKAINHTSASGGYLDHVVCGSTEPNEPLPSTLTVNSTWHRWTAPSTGYVEFSTCDAATDFDTRLAVYTGSTLANLIESGQDDDDSNCSAGIGSAASTLALPVAAGDVLYAAVSGFSDLNQGKYRISWTHTPDTTVPEAAELLMPVNITTDLTPTFKWTDVGATHYRLWVDDSSAGSPDIMNWYADNAICDDGICTVDAGAVAVGNVTWNVQSYSSTAGPGSWAGLENFVASSANPDAAVKWTPTGNVTDSTPVFMWKASSNAEEYQVFQQVDESYFAGSVSGRLSSAEVNCPYGTGYCSYQTDAVHATGAARYWIISYNDNGSTGSGWFTYNRTSGTAGAGLPYTPPVSSLAPGNPVTFTWSAHPGATNYRLFVRDAAGITRADVTLNAAAMGCASGAGTCSRTVSGIPAGNARWFVRNKFGAVWGGWSRATWFTAPTP